jgi:GntP family gluconate:H+ symporter
VKESVVGLVGEGGQNMGLVMLCVGFGVAAVMKTAQGSSTVAMITTSSMVAAMGVSQGMLGFHPVYLAVAIGCGSLVGSWMNDSGFWIFARMSGLTEVEALKSWTVLLVILGFTGMIFTVFFALVLPPI